MDIGEVIKSEIKMSYNRFCHKNCPVMWTIDCAEDNYKDEMIQTYCESCLVKTFIIQELGIKF